MVSLAIAKNHLRVDFDDDDAEIELMIAAAGDHLRSTNVDMDIQPMPPAIQQAVLLLVGHFYKYRDATSDFKHFPLDIGVDRLVAPYRDHSI